MRIIPAKIGQNHGLGDVLEALIVDVTRRATHKDHRTSFDHKISRRAQVS